ncbi:MAG: hypothetical protein IJN42_02930 [Clostridia bacterium]|nr:hypothetical protein [Clostridia bacterium]
MECLRCHANLKDNAVVCKKCGFIVKGAKKVEVVEPTVTFEETVNNASAEELRAMLLALKAKRDAANQPKVKKSEKLAPEQLAARSGKRWATAAFLCGLFSLLFVVVPGVNIILALILFILAFIGFGKSNGHRTNLAMFGLILTIIAIAASWVYNSYAAPIVGNMLGLTQAGEAVSEGMGEVSAN